MHTSTDYIGADPNTNMFGRCGVSIPSSVTNARRACAIVRRCEGVHSHRIARLRNLAEWHVARTDRNGEPHVVTMRLEASYRQRLA